MVALLFSIVIVFLCCHTTRLALNVYEAVQMIQFGTIQFWPVWADNLTRWNHLMLVVNSSINILVYMAKDFKFRQAFFLMFRCEKEVHARPNRRGKLLNTNTSTPSAANFTLVNSSSEDEKSVL
eukprot:GFUD01135086.1.p1 GENE.GFUD01135086.1~~GFUD01135086.1.p1  ORF type:complete len:137 (-),score=35.16 GFUD01135086.1:27-398(-)